MNGPTDTRSSADEVDGGSRPDPLYTSSEIAQGEPWIESREGMWFFLNAVLVAPAFVVAVPSAIGGIVRLIGLVEGFSPFLDTVPMVASHLLPRVGWLALIPAYAAVRGLRMEITGLPRRLLWIFLAVHVVTLLLFILSWVT